MTFKLIKQGTGYVSSDSRFIINKLPAQSGVISVKVRWRVTDLHDDSRAGTLIVNRLYECRDWITFRYAEEAKEVQK